jgi:hypothetical protein
MTGNTIKGPPAMGFLKSEGLPQCRIYYEGVYRDEGFNTQRVSRRNGRVYNQGVSRKDRIYNQGVSRNVRVYIRGSPTMAGDTIRGFPTLSGSTVGGFPALPWLTISESTVMGGVTI